MSSYMPSTYSGGTPSYSGYTQPSQSSSAPARSMPQPSGSGKEIRPADKETKSEQEPTKEYERELAKEDHKEAKKISAEKSTSNQGRAKSDKKEEEPEKEALVKLFAKLESNFDDLDQLYEQHTMLANIKNDLLSDEVPDFDLVEEGLKGLVGKLKNAKKIIGDIANEIKDYNQADKTRIKASLDKIVEKQAEHFDTISTEIKDIEVNAATLTITPIKRFFYLGDESQKEAVLATTLKEFHQYVDRQYLKIQNNNALTLFSLAQAWKDLNDTFRADFNKLLPTRRRRRQ